MSPKEKADELIRKYYSIGAIEVKQCVLIAVNEIIKANPTGEYGDPFIGDKVYDNKNYWREVKRQIEEL